MIPLTAIRTFNLPGRNKNDWIDLVVYLNTSNIEKRKKTDKNLISSYARNTLDLILLTNYLIF